MPTFPERTLEIVQMALDEGASWSGIARDFGWSSKQGAWNWYKRQTDDLYRQCEVERIRQLRRGNNADQG